MDTQLEAIQMLIRMNREAQRELAKVEETTSADFVHIGKVQQSLNEQFHLLLQQKEELEAAVAIRHEARPIPVATVPPEPLAPASEPKEKRGRGAEKQHYLKDPSQRPLFIARLQRIFVRHYRLGKLFCLPDGMEVKAPSFLACLYDLGIKLGITSPEVPVRDFSIMVTDAATGCAQTCSEVRDFNTAYNTVQKEIKRWSNFTGNKDQYYGVNVRFHRIKAADVPSEKLPDYKLWCNLYSQVEQIYHDTEEA